jgi:hypothetical protein
MTANANATPVEYVADGVHGQDESQPTGTAPVLAEAIVRIELTNMAEKAYVPKSEALGT